MRLNKILQDIAARCEGFACDTDSAYSTVSIYEIDDPENCVFMQGEEADNFIAECEKIETRIHGCIPMHVIELAQASPYIECCLV